jgi:hypothetical protein
MSRRLVLPALLGVAAMAALPLRAMGQTPPPGQMPDLRAMSGRPLPVPDLPTGTVVLRVVRQSPANPAVGVEVTTTTRNLAGEARSGNAKTGADGRVTFEGLPTGAEFQATVTVDGERLDTVRFPLPRTGGVRIMLIAGLGPAPTGGVGEAAGEPGEAQKNAFRMGATTGTVAPAPELPTGTLEIDVRDSGGRPLVGNKVQLAEVRMKPGAQGGGHQPEREVGVHEAVTDGQGRVRYNGLATGEAAGFAAVTESEGMRIGTQPFRMPAQGGLRGQIVALGRTADPSLLQLDPRSKIIFDLREDSVLVMLALAFRNPSQDIFDPGEGGLMVPLPEGAVGAQEMEGSEQLDITPGQGVRLKSPIPPDGAASFLTPMRFGYVLPAEGTSRLELRQVLPVVLNEPFILVPAKAGLELEAAGLRKLPDEADSQGEKVYAYTLPPIAAGGTLALNIIGIPARDRSGRTVAAVLCVLLVLGAVVLAGPARGQAAHVADREALAERREKLFAELVELEQQRRDEEPRAGANGRLADKRRELVTRLESVYRDLAKIEEGISI